MADSFRGLVCFLPRRGRDDNGLTHSPAQAQTAEEIADAMDVLLRKLKEKELSPVAQNEATVMEESLQRLRSSLETVCDPSPSLPTNVAAPVPTAGYPDGRAELAMAAQKSLQPGALAPAINDLIKILWPRIGTFVEDLIQNSIAPSINASLPGLVQKGGGVKFTKISLGESSPKLGPIMVEVDKDTGAITWHMGVDVSCDIDVELTALGIPIAITKFCLKGDLVALLSPPMNKPPFFGGVEVFFPNPPDVEIGFGGAARVADVPGLRGAIRGAIDSAVAGICVLPRRIAVDMDDEDVTDMVDLSYPEPTSIMRVTLWSAANLVAADSHIIGGASSDPYVVTSLGIKSSTSPHVSKNLNPVWGDGAGLTSDFPVHDGSQALSLKVFDYDFGTSDDVIGVAQRLEVRSLVQDGKPQTVQLQKANGESGGGSLSISASKLALSLTRPTQAIPSGPSEAHLHAKMLTIKGLAADAAYPFKVCVQIAGPGEKDAALVEDSTQPSHPQEQKQLAEAYQEIARNLSAKGTSPEEIADILEVGVKQVKSYLLTVDDDKLKQQLLKEQLEIASVSRPRFDEALQLLLPCDSVKDTNFVVLTIFDKKQKQLGVARVPLKDVLSAPSLELKGPFTTDSNDVQVVGSLRLRWLDVQPQ